MIGIYLSMLETQDEKDKISLFYEENYEFFISYATKILKDKTLAEDLVHEFFIKVIGKKEKFLTFEPIDFRNYGVTSIEHMCFNLIRDSKKIANTSISDVGETISDDKPIDIGIETKEEMQLLRECLSELTPINRQIIDLKYGFEMKTKNIAEELNLTVAQVNSSLERSRTKLKKLMLKKTTIIN